jgi:two-component sensor histidine kinase
VHPFVRARPFLRTEGIEGKLELETAYRGVRNAVLNALVGADGAGDAAQRAGLGVAARIALTLLAFAVAAIIWEGARFGGIVGAAAFYFPAILIVTLFAGWEFGVALLAASVALIWAVAKPPPPGAPLAVFAVAGLIQLLLVAFIRRLLRDSWRAERALKSLADRREREADSREITLGEARHRLKNLMAIIEALAKFSAGRTGVEPGVDAYLKRFLGRLRALGTASDLVLKHRPDVIEATAVVGVTLEPFLSDMPPRLRFDGPVLELSEQMGGALALAVHELATNALKYGALSVPSGSVTFTWTTTPRDGGTHVVFLWKEDGGPPPSPPVKDGFGHRMIRSVTAREAQGEVSIDYPPDGLVCRIAFLRKPPRPAEIAEHP